MHSSFLNAAFPPSAPRGRAAAWPAALVLTLSALACGGGDGAADPVDPIPPVPPPCAVSGVVVSPATATVRAGQGTTLTAAVTTADCTAAPVTWATSNPAVATVSAAGVVTGVAGGQAAITATTGGRSNTVAVTTVVDPGVAFVYSEQASPALDVPYTPRLDFQRSPGGTPATVTRTGTGSYTVLFPYVLPAPGQGVVALAAAVLTGTGVRNCQVRGWSPGVNHRYRVDVLCVSVATFSFGDPVDSPFTVQLVGAGALAGRHGIVWAGDPTAATYTPDPNYSTNSAGGAITITRDGTGHYRVRWAGIARPGGAVETVVAAPVGLEYGRCTVMDWVADGSDLVAEIQCAALNGSAADRPFVALVAEQGRSGRHYAVALADRATAPIGSAYDASTNGNSRTSAGGAITITHQATGTYLVHLAGLTRSAVPGGTAPETVVVTAFDSNVLCQAAIWAILADGTYVAVECRNPDGTYATNGTRFDSAFTLYLVE